MYIDYNTYYLYYNKLDSLFYDINQFKQLNYIEIRNYLFKCFDFSYNLILDLNINKLNRFKGIHNLKKYVKSILKFIKEYGLKCNFNLLEISNLISILHKLFLEFKRVLSPINNLKENRYFLTNFNKALALNKVLEL